MRPRQMSRSICDESTPCPQHADFCRSQGQVRAVGVSGTGRDYHFAAAPGSSPSARSPGCPTAAVGELRERAVPATSGHPCVHQTAAPATGFKVQQTQLIVCLQRCILQSDRGMTSSCQQASASCRLWDWGREAISLVGSASCVRSTGASAQADRPGTGRSGGCRARRSR